MVHLWTAAVYVVALIHHGDEEQTHTIGHQSLIYFLKNIISGIQRSKTFLECKFCN
jgi:hypothetical protein